MVAYHERAVRREQRRERNEEDKEEEEDPPNQNNNNNIDNNDDNDNDNDNTGGIIRKKQVFVRPVAVGRAPSSMKGNDEPRLRIILGEGRNREVRKLCEMVGLDVKVREREREREMRARGG